MDFRIHARCTRKVQRRAAVALAVDAAVDTAAAPPNPELNCPFGLAFHDGYLYVGNTDSVIRYKYTNGDTKAAAAGQKIATVPGGENHWTRNILFSRDGRKMFVSVGSSNNIDDTGRAMRIGQQFMSTTPMERFPALCYGYSQPCRSYPSTSTNAIWTAVNERDGLGDELVPDYATSVKDGGFYGWPYSYIGNHVDTRVPNQKADLVAKAIVPDVLIPAHSAALGLTFYTGTQFPQRYRNGSVRCVARLLEPLDGPGIKVIFVPFANNRPSGPIEDFLTGFVVEPQSFEVGPTRWGDGDGGRFFARFG